MFSWVCPDCGATVQASSDVCPSCSARDAPASESAAGGLERDTEIDSPDPQPPSAGEVPQPPPSASKAGPAVRDSLQLQKQHYLLFVIALVLAILVAVWASGSGPSLFSGLRLEDPEEMEVSLVETFAIGVRGPVEVSGIRPYYDEDFQTHVKAFVANHSKRPQSVALRVLLRGREASQQAPPLATFNVVIPDPIDPNGGTEVDVVLYALGSLQSLPPWDEMRVDVELLGSGGG